MLANLSGVAVLHGHFALGEQTLLLYVLHGPGEQSGAEVAMSLAQVATWCGGLMVQSKVYPERDEALADLGISQALEPIAP